MVRKCVVPNCRLDEQMQGCKILGFRRFPKNEEYKKIWIQALKENFSDKVDDLLKVKKLFICDLHFNDSCFYKTGKGLQLLLQKESTPSIFTNLRSTAPKTIIDKYERIWNFLSNNVISSDDNNQCHIDSANVPYTCLDDSNMSSVNNLTINSTNDSIKVVNLSTNESIKGVVVKNSSHKRKSLGEVDLKSIDYTNVPEMKKFMKQMQNEVLLLHRTIIKQRKEIKSIRMKMYRSKVKVKNIKSLICHVKNEKFISEKVSSIL